MSLPDTHLELLGTSKFDIQKRLGSHRVETSPAEACNSCRNYGGALGDEVETAKFQDILR